MRDDAAFLYDLTRSIWFRDMADEARALLGDDLPAMESAFFSEIAVSRYGDELNEGGR